MKRKFEKKQLTAEINITPFTDVILVLLVIFMIVTPLISQSDIKVNLPTAKTAESSPKSRQTAIEISIKSDGELYFNGRISSEEGLRQGLAVWRKKDPEISVLIQSDKATRFQHIVRVMDIVRELGITKIKIAVTPE